MADFFINQVLDAEEDRLEYRLGQMDIEEAYERGIIDELGYENICRTMLHRPTLSGATWHEANNAACGAAVANLGAVLLRQLK